MKPARMPHSRIKVRPWYYSWRIQPSRHRDEAAALNFEKEANDMNDNQLDLNLLGASIDGYVPFSVRYGFRKISDFVSPNPNYPSPPGFLWESPGSDISEPMLGSPHDFEAQGTGIAALGAKPVVSQGFG